MLLRNVFVWFGITMIIELKAILAEKHIEK